MFSRKTLEPLTEIAHIEQSIVDIITTPVGSRLMNRAYGSQLFSYVDQPLNEETRLNLIVATGEAIEQWEKRVSLKGLLLNPEAFAQGIVELLVTFVVKATGQTVQTTIAGAV